MKVLANNIRATNIGSPNQVTEGKALPLGATADANGVNFSVFSQHASTVDLLLFDSATATVPSQVIAISSRTLHYWHVYVKGLAAGAFYAFRVSGPSSAHDLHDLGHRFNSQKVLLDPYSRGNSNALWVEADAISPNDNVATCMRSVVAPPDQFDWEGDRPLSTPRRNSVIYELHVRGFTRSNSSGARNPGTFLGLIEKIPYIKSLGVTAVELMPVFDFDERTVKRVNPQTGERLHNYWGYDPYSYFAPQSAYCTDADSGTQANEFRQMVKAFHKAGIEVILDVVFNHTGEGDGNGPVINFKGFDNSVYYYVDPADGQRYLGYSGLGNTVHCNHPAVSELIAESIAYWVNVMHVDGFRFDLGSILTLGENGERMKYPPVVWTIDLDPSLQHVKVIAEPFGAGQYLIGSFPDVRWGTWNYLYRDAIRRFVRGDPGIVGEVATRIAGSSDIYEPNLQKPVNSVNYVACHDGFTLYDVVSYNSKHNDPNGGNSGDDDNKSWNCGAEGPTSDPSINRLRLKQQKNFLTLLFVSQGIPMMLAGDEAGRTQRGNNDPWCQDNEVSWYDWTLAGRNAELVRFASHAIAFHQRHDGLRREEYFQGVPSNRGLLDIQWHGCLLGQPGWKDPSSRVLSFTIADPGNGEDVHVMLNMDDQLLAFDLPPVLGRTWYRAVDTTLASPDDFMDAGQEVRITGTQYWVNPKSSVVLVSK